MGHPFRQHPQHTPACGQRVRIVIMFGKARLQTRIGDFPLALVLIRVSRLADHRRDGLGFRLPLLVQLLLGL